MSSYQILSSHPLTTVSPGTAGSNRARLFSGPSRISPTHSAATSRPPKDGTSQETSPNLPGTTTSPGTATPSNSPSGTAPKSNPGSTTSLPSPTKSSRTSPTPHQTRNQTARPKTKHKTQPQQTRPRDNTTPDPATIQPHCINGTTRAVPGHPLTSSKKTFPTGSTTAK